MYRFVRNWPFLCLGFLTLGLFIGVEAMGEPARTTLVGEALVAIVRVLVVAMWLMRYLELFLGMGRLPQVFQLLVAVPLLLAPYVAADLSLRWLLRGDSKRS